MKLSERVRNAIANEGPRTNNADALAAEVRDLEEYADKLADGLPMLPKDIEVLREANLQLATRNVKLEAVEEALKRAIDIRDRSEIIPMTVALYEALAALENGNE